MGRIPSIFHEVIFSHGTMTTTPSETSSDGNTLFQNSVYIGIILEDILYGESRDAYHETMQTYQSAGAGVELLLYFKTIHILLSNRGGARKKSNIFYALFSSMMMLSITVWVATQALFGQQMWLLESDFPGGPDAYWSANIWVWYMDWGTTSVIILQLMTDGLMVGPARACLNVCSFRWSQIYRCRIIWNSYRAIVVPAILWLSSLGKHHTHHALAVASFHVHLVLGVLVDWTSSSPGGDFYTGVASQFGLAYCGVSVALSTILACMICYRLVRHGRRVREHLGHEYASPYFAVVTLVVESVLPCTLSGIAFLVSLGVGSPTSVAFVCVYFMMLVRGLRLLIVLTKLSAAHRSASPRRC
jgi:hypothetical protein